MRPQKPHNIIYSGRDGSNNCLGNWNISENLKACSACIANFAIGCAHSEWCSLTCLGFCENWYHFLDIWILPTRNQAGICKSSAIEQGQLLYSLLAWKSFIFLTTNYNKSGGGSWKSIWFSRLLFRKLGPNCFAVKYVYLFENISAYSVS